MDGDGTNLRVVQHRFLHNGAYLQLAFGEHDCWDSVVMTKKDWSSSRLTMIVEVDINFFGLGFPANFVED